MATELEQAKKNKADEFYTQLSDIEAEMRHYKEHFKDKVIFCNCDDPYESNFFKYFAMNFNFLGIKKLIATCYTGSPVAGEQLSLFDVESFKEKSTEAKHPYKIEITEVGDENADGAVDLSDVEYLLKNRKNALTLLHGDGDFRSPECTELLKEADIVVTNPPFSLFREYITQLIEYDKNFIIIGNVNAITYKEVFKLIKENRVWLGQSIRSGDREFRVPDYYPLQAAGFRIDENGVKYIRVKGVRWFTNLDFEERHENITLYKQYTPEEYPHYDNYDAIEVSKTAEIPYDYDGAMGVPITFLDKHNPEQFEILGITQGRDEFGTKPTKWYINPKQINPDGTVSNGGKVNTGAQILLPHIPKGVYFIADNADGPLRRVYARILIKRKGAAQ
ncbi:MAG: adenine-specific methyltransferase EcoRI family protein [Bacillota bacterium]